MFEFMSRKIILPLILLTFLQIVGYAQTPYGNDWINHNQAYYKIKVVNKGIYRITASQLGQYYSNLNSLDPKNFQIYKNGIEQAIYVHGQADNSFDSNDFIEFYGEGNDGRLDTELYVNANDQPHKYYSLFTDTAAYYLTYAPNVAGKRIQNFKASTSGLNPEAYILSKSLKVFTDAYYQGRYIIAHMSLSDYQAGEGFLGAVYGKGQTQSNSLNTPFLYTGSGASSINLETYVAGRSDADSPHPQRYNHHLRIGINNGTTTYYKKDTLFRGYEVIRTNINLLPNEIGSTSTVIYQSINDLGMSNEATDYQAPAYALITYPRLPNLQNTNWLNFGLGSSSQNRWLSFNNNNLAKPIVWDIENQQRIVGTINGNTVDFVLAAANQNYNYYLADSAAYTPTTLSKVNFVNLSPASFDKDFLIVTNNKLLTSAQNYANYRQLKGFKPLLITTEQLYDQFYYGVHHPLAIKNFIKYLMQYANIKPKYLLLLGKGLENHLVRSASGLADDLVPTYGSPPSDDLLTARINSTSLAPALATGRLGASTNSEVELYLQKLQRYEQYPNALWRKKFIHISGGANLSENISWANYQANMYNMAKDVPFGADTVNFNKNVGLPVSTNQKQRIIGEINKGAALLSFLGHGAHQATEIDFGHADELDNANTLLTYLVNGCTTGNTYIYEPSLGDKLMFFPDKGAIGWIGTSSEGVASYLSSFSSIFYRNVFNTNYGASIAEAIRLSKQQYQNLNDVINVMHTTQYTFQGDPALKFYTPSKPDFAIEDQDLFISPNNVNAMSNTFRVGLIAKNIGKAINQPLKINLARTLPDNSTINYPSINANPVFNTDTVYFDINQNNLSSAGMNRFQVILDPDNQFDELSKTNNSANLNYFFASNGVNLLYPKPYAIVGKNTVDLVAQSSDLAIKNAEYIFELDTLSTFDSPWKRSSTINSGFMPKWQVVLPNTTNKAYYWRVRLNVDPDKGGTWQSASFTYIQDSPDGWAQTHFQQLKDATLTSLEYNGQKLEFAKTAFATSIQTRGDDAPTVDERTYRSNPGGRLGYLGYEFVGFTLIALNPTTMRAYNYPSPYNVVNNDGAGPYYSGQFYYDTNNPIAVDSLVAHLNRIPEGYKVMGFNGRGINLSALPQAAINAFKQVGVAQIGNIGPGEPYMFWGVKGAAQGTAIEKTADYTSQEPAKNQQIKFDVTYGYPLTQGTYISAKAGPATKWTSASFSSTLESGDQVVYDLLGYKPDGSSDVLQSNLSGNTINLSAYDATQYPKMGFRVKYTDASNRTPAQPLQWKFLYNELPEAGINTEIKHDFYNNTIQEGDSIKWHIAYQNFSKYQSDSVNIYYSLTKPDRSVVSAKVGKIPALAPGASQIFTLKLPSLGLVGNNLLKMDFEPINGLDSYAFNNYIQQRFQVSRDNKEPLVDVSFDGKRIMNGEIVSPQPNINISLSDENPYILLSDTSALTVYLKDENNNFKKIAYSSGLLSFMPATTANNNKATAFFKPQKLDDGIYTLMVEAKDASGNKNPSNNYTIDFEVINEASVSNFYPYPNPFSTAMKFVFTLTGDKVPDNIKVQIMTISGKVVREVLKNELGNLRIGNNISDFTWDGTDMYGDKLANGVYFYKVSIENNDHSSIKHRSTGGDKYFKKNIGKIYLMR